MASSQGREITLMVRPLEDFDDALRAMPDLFRLAPAMTKHWALKVGSSGAKIFEIGIGEDRIYAGPPLPWQDVERKQYDWISRRIGTTLLSDDDIFQHAHEVISVMSKEQNVSTGGNAQYNIISANCQKYSKLLYELIRVPGISDLASGLQSLPKPIEVFVRRCTEIGVSGTMLVVCVALVASALLIVPSLIIRHSKLAQASSRKMIAVLVVSTSIFTAIQLFFMHLSISFCADLLRPQEQSRRETLLLLISPVLTALAFGASWKLIHHVAQLQPKNVSGSRPVVARMGFVIALSNICVSAVWCIKSLGSSRLVRHDVSFENGGAIFLIWYILLLGSFVVLFTRRRTDILVGKFTLDGVTEFSVMIGLLLFIFVSAFWFVLNKATFDMSQGRRDA